MLDSKILALAGAGLLISAPIFPQHAPGFLAAGAISGGACWIVGEKEREVTKRLAGISEKERQLKTDQGNIEVLKIQYTRSLANIEARQKELTAQAQEIADQRLQCEFIKSLKAGLDKREQEIQALKIELDKAAFEQKERCKYLEGWSAELDRLESKSHTEKEKLAVWATELKHQSANIERQRIEIQKNRDSFNELLKAYQQEIWQKLIPQAQAHAEAIIAERQKPLDQWSVELKQKENQLNEIVPKIDEARKKELKELEEKWQKWGQTTVDDCNAKIRAALDDRNTAHDTWKQHYMVLAGKAHQENQQLRKVIYSPGRHWWELKADIVIEFLNANEVVVDYYQALPTPDEKGFYVELEPKWGAEALADILTGVTKLRDALKGLVADCKQKPTIECANKRIKLTFVMTSPDYVRDLAKASGQAASAQKRDDFLKFLDQVSQVAILGATGGGKTVLLANTIGAFSKQLGEATNLVIVNPKPSRASRDLGIAKYNSLEQSIFGLLEVAVEISYRIKLNEIAERDNPEDPAYPDHEPIIYLFDEYSEVATKWNSVSKKKMDSVVIEFSEGLDAARKEVLATLIEDISPKRFASTLLNTVWRLGRSEKVRVIVAGQNLMPQLLGFHKQDIWNPAFVIIGDLIWWGITNRAHSFQKADLEEEFKNRMDAAEEDESQRFFGLFCAPRAKATFLNLPAPNQYKFSQRKVVQNQLEGLYKRSAEVDILYKEEVDVDESDSLEPLQDEDDRSVQDETYENAKADNPPKRACGDQDVQPGHISRKDEERLEIIKKIWAEGKTTLKEIVHVVWCDVEGVETYGSRPWRKAREEYRRLTGK